MPPADCMCAYYPIILQKILFNLIFSWNYFPFYMQPEKEAIASII